MSEAGLVYNLSGQKFIKNENLCGQTALPDSSILKGQKLVENAKIQKIQMRHFG